MNMADITFPKNIADYVKLYHDVFLPEQCNELIEYVKGSNWEKHHYATPDNKFSTFEDDFLTATPEGEIVTSIQNKLWHVIYTYMAVDMLHSKEWFNTWSGYTGIRINKYDTGTQMRTHCDHITSMFDGKRKGIPMLSVLGALNSDYEGGDFLMWGSFKIEIPTGSVLIFPSNFLYPHCVNKVTKGTRYSFVSWVW